MKNNIFVHLFVIVLLSIFFCSCEEKSASDNASNTSNQEVVDKTNSNVNKDSIKQVEIKIENLKSQIEDISTKSESSLTDLKNSIKEIKSHNTWCVIIAWAISLVSFIIAIVSIVKVSKLNGRLDHHRNEIEQLKGEISNINFRPQQQVRPSSKTVSFQEFSALASRVIKIENTVMNNTSNVSNRDFNRSTNIPKEEPKEISKNGYFGTAVCGEGGKGYFRKLLDSSEEARFRVIVMGDFATYEPTVPLNAIKSSDAMDLAIEFEGATKNEATDMTVKYKGKAQKMGDKWIIINKVVVTLK